MKQESIDAKVQRIRDALDRMDRGMYPGLSIGMITDQIAWLWKFRYIDYDTMTELATHAIYTLSIIRPATF